VPTGAAKETTPVGQGTTLKNQSKKQQGTLEQVLADVILAGCGDVLDELVEKMYKNAALSVNISQEQADRILGGAREVKLEVGIDISKVLNPEP
jgi:hypothetical protein